MEHPQVSDRRTPQLIVGRLMRELGRWWPQSLKFKDGEEGEVVLDLANGPVRESRVAITPDNCQVALLAMSWLTESGKVKCTRTDNIRILELTEAGVDCLNSLDAFRRHCEAQTRTEKEEIVPNLERELADKLGPPFLAWLTASR